MKIMIRIIVTSLVLLHACIVRAENPLLIATEPWPPYSMEENNELIGVDVEIINVVFKKMGITIKIQTFPWKRCLYMVRHKEVDAILDASITSERQQFLHFPEEPVSKEFTVFFSRKGRTIPFTGLEDLNGLTAGVIIGYSYCDEIDLSPFMKNAESVSLLKNNFKKLLLDRIDFIIESEAVGYFTAKEMGISDQITIIPEAYYCPGGNYLAFAKKSGYDKIAFQFSRALKTFKTTEEYKQILKSYGSIFQ